MKVHKLGKISALLLVFGILFSMKFTYAADAISVKVSSTSGNQGDEVTVSVELGNVPTNGIDTGQFVIKYDKSKIEYKSYSAGDIVFDKTRDLNIEVFDSGLTVIYSDATQDGSSLIKKNGVLCNFVFKIISGNGQIQITAENEDPRVTGQLDSVPFYHASGTYTSYEAAYTGGTITVPKQAGVSSTPAPTGNSTAQTTASATPNGTPVPTTIASDQSKSSTENSSNFSRKFQVEAELKVGDPNITSGGNKQLLNANNNNVTPTFGDNGVVLPVKEVCEYMGATIEWDAIQKKIRIIYKERKTEMWIGKSNVVLNGKTKVLGNCPELIDNRPYIPLELASVSLGCIVEWDKTSDLIRIKK